MPEKPVAADWRSAALAAYESAQVMGIGEAESLGNLRVAVALDQQLATLPTQAIADYPLGRAADEPPGPPRQAVRVEPHRVGVESDVVVVAIVVFESGEERCHGVRTVPHLAQRHLDGEEICILCRGVRELAGGSPSRRVLRVGDQ